MDTLSVIPHHSVTKLSQHFMDFLLDVLDPPVNGGLRHAQLHGDLDPGVVLDSQVKDRQLVWSEVAHLTEKRALQLSKLRSDIQGSPLLPLARVFLLVLLESILLDLDPGPPGLSVRPPVDCHLRHYKYLFINPS